ncbi:Formate/nitrite transporter [Suhomyces tanzawaensis NRRL Y-17324]|uniref:Formate/nitrite transporter n=1 Tax=Suhomyces tanzawaensis NRRL Y-17324 TaxID=984487 RepID=A0A1E4SQU6_9ASCO|nr:Formate/nitrite transporter [Suhomyces tanzawaensis NRRL Y-17324]ODV81871.1 Formate/nitrite transporter [Suhomyces tanzawaensis NRRL Y-17324]
MPDESLYLTTYETALAVVATAMKKARLRLDTLVLNSLMAGILFSTGGMLHVNVQAGAPELLQLNPALVQLLQGLVYPIGLFYVVVMGVDLFNANVLYFSVGLCRGAVSVLDLCTSWFVTWWFNLVANIFVCYIICNYSHVTQHENYVRGSVEILMAKAEYSFVDTMLKSMAGNFFAALAIYLQLMAKPLHVKFLMMTLPVFSFVSMGFTHSVADMYMVIIGLINHAPISVGTVAWKIFLPGVIGNIIGGSFFGVAVWYLHLVVVERDQAALNLPVYEARDEQPDLNMDSRVVRVKSHDYPEEFDEKSRLDEVPDMNNASGGENQFLRRISTTLSRGSTRTLNKVGRSPKNVFPVYGMGPPLEKENSVAAGHYTTVDDTYDNDAYSAYTARENLDTTSAEFIGDQIRRVLTRRSSKARDFEARIEPSLMRRQSNNRDYPLQLH